MQKVRDIHPISIRKTGVLYIPNRVMRIDYRNKRCEVYYILNKMNRYEITLEVSDDPEAFLKFYPEMSGVRISIRDMYHKLRLKLPQYTFYVDAKIVENKIMFQLELPNGR